MRQSFTPVSHSGEPKEAKQPVICLEQREKEGRGGKKKAEERAKWVKFFFKKLFPKGKKKKKKEGQDFL